MSRFSKNKRQPGAEFTYDGEPGGEADLGPTPLYPDFLEEVNKEPEEEDTNSHSDKDYVVPWARKLSEAEQSQVDHYRRLRQRFHDGPFYSVLDSASTSAKKGTAARANFDPFTGMPSYSGRYQKKHRTLPKIDPNGGEHEFDMRYLPRELWSTVQPSYKPDAQVDGGFQAMNALGTSKRGFEDDDEDEAEAEGKKRETGDDEEGGDMEGEGLDDDEAREEWEEENDFEDDEDEMGGDYNAEQYFDGGDDDMGDDDGAGGGGEDEM